MVRFEIMGSKPKASMVTALNGYD